MEEQYKINNDEMEINLIELLYQFRRRWWALLLALIIGGGAAGSFSVYLMTPQYSSSASLYVLSKETTLTSLADLQIGSQLTQDYKVMITCRQVLQNVITDLQLDIDDKALRNKITIDNPVNTRILMISVMDPDPYRAKAIADRVALASSDYIGEIMEMVPPKLIEEGVVATEQSSPNVRKNILLGGFVALFLVCAVISIRTIMDDAIKTEEDVSKYLNLPVLATLPIVHGKTPKNVKSRATKERKKHKSGRKTGKDDGR